MRFVLLARVNYNIYYVAIHDIHKPTVNDVEDIVKMKAPYQFFGKYIAYILFLRRHFDVILGSDIVDILIAVSLDKLAEI